jgi:CBS domain-containing protein
MAGGIGLAQQKRNNDTLSLRAIDVMVREVVMIDENASVKEAVEIMNRLEISSIIATRNGDPIGLVTERDILKRIVAEGKAAKETFVRDIMSTPLTVILPEAGLEEAAHLMFDKKIKKLPVVHEGNMIGLLSLTDIARYQPHMMKILKALSVMRETPKSITKVIDAYVV